MYLDNFNLSYENMMNPEIKSDFIYSKFSHLQETDIKTIIRFFNAIGITEQQNQKDFSEFTFKEVLDLFERNEWQHANTFAHNKSILKQYVDFCKTQNKISGDTHPIERISKNDIVGTIKFDRQYFKSPDDCIECLEDVYNSADVDDSSQFIPAKSVYNLSSLRFTKEEIRFFKKDDFNAEERSITSSLSGFKVNNLSDYVVKLLQECIDIKDYVSHNKYAERNIYYQENDYLIRTTKSLRVVENEPVNEVYFNNINVKFNKITSSYSPTSKYYKKSITCDSIYNSGMYFKLYEYENDHQSLEYNYELLNELGRFDTDDVTMLGRFYDNYLKWRKYFYGD